MPSEIEEFEVDYLLLADRAEVHGGKIYMMGGGWNRRIIGNLESPVELTIVMGVLVPWNLTNEKLDITVRIYDTDGNVLEPLIKASITAGRPPEAVSGQVFRVPMVLKGNWTLPHLGDYTVEASLPDRVLKKTVFYAVEPKKVRSR